MQRFSYSIVKSVKRLTDRTLEIVLDQNVPKELKLNEDCVENMTCTHLVEIQDCYFTDQYHENISDCSKKVINYKQYIL